MLATTDQNSKNKGTLLVFDFDNTIVNGHLHNYCTKIRNGIKDSLTQEVVVPGREVTNEDVDKFIKDVGIKNRDPLIDLLKKSLANGTEVHVASYTAYAKEIKCVIDNHLDLSPEEAARIIVTGGFPKDLNPVLTGDKYIEHQKEFGKNFHICQLMEKYKSEHEGGLPSTVLLIDDSKPNIDRMGNFAASLSTQETWLNEHGLTTNDLQNINFLGIQAPKEKGSADYLEQAANIVGVDLLAESLDVGTHEQTPPVLPPKPQTSLVLPGKTKKAASPLLNLLSKTAKETKNLLLENYDQSKIEDIISALEKMELPSSGSNKSFLQIFGIEKATTIDIINMLNSIKEILEKPNITITDKNITSHYNAHTSERLTQQPAAPPKSKLPAAQLSQNLNSFSAGQEQALNSTKAPKTNEEQLLKIISTQAKNIKSLFVETWSDRTLEKILQQVDLPVSMLLNNVDTQEEKEWLSTAKGIEDLFTNVQTTLKKFNITDQDIKNRYGTEALKYDIQLNDEQIFKINEVYEMVISDTPPKTLAINTLQKIIDDTWKATDSHVEKMFLSITLEKCEISDEYILEYYSKTFSYNGIISPEEKGIYIQKIRNVYQAEINKNVTKPLNNMELEKVINYAINIVNLQIDTIFEYQVEVGTANSQATLPVDNHLPPLPPRSPSPQGQQGAKLTHSNLPPTPPPASAKPQSPTQTKDLNTTLKNRYEPKALKYGIGNLTEEQISQIRKVYENNSALNTSQTLDKNVLKKTDSFVKKMFTNLLYKQCYITPEGIKARFKEQASSLSIEFTPAQLSQLTIIYNNEINKKVTKPLLQDELHTIKFDALNVLGSHVDQILKEDINNNVDNKQKFRINQKGGDHTYENISMKPSNQAPSLSLRTTSPTQKGQSSSPLVLNADTIKTLTLCGADLGHQGVNTHSDYPPTPPPASAKPGAAPPLLPPRAASR